VRYRSSTAVFIRRLLFLALILGALFILAVVGWKFWVDSRATNLVYSYDSVDLPERELALVLGAGLNAAGGPSAMLYDRVDTAVDLYEAGKVRKLLMSGDNSTVNYNEVEVMRRTALELGVPDNDIYMDHAGFNTWDSCYRAKAIFEQNEVTIVTQKFHLPRALYSCNHLGVKSIGVAADRQRYDTLQNELREIPALMGLAFRIITNDQPRFLGPTIDVDKPQPR
jgi:SanA protein